jgi:LysM repeat protein
MTRETKIGLLVGLAFIIVIGILLEDHFATMQEPRPAQLGQAGDNVRRGSAMPATHSSPENMPGNGQTRHQVPTGVDLSRQQAARQIIQGDPNGTEQCPEGGRNETRVDIGPGPTERRDDQANGGNNTHAVDNRRNDQRSLEETARRMGESIVPVNNDTRHENAPPPPLKQYTAEAGDTVSRLAARFLGANNRANRDAIIKANPSLQENPNIIIVGKLYNIPAKPGTAAPPTGGGSPGPTGPVAQRPTPAPSNENWYVTKPGDTLWRIAAEQCGSPAARQAILELNAGAISDPNRLPVNLKLKLPPKAVAAVN